MKAFIYMNDVAADQGPASVVRGSHRISQLGVTPAGLFDFASGGFRAHREHADQKEAAQAPFTGRGAGNTESNGLSWEWVYCKLLQIGFIMFLMAAWVKLRDLASECHTK